MKTEVIMKRELFGEQISQKSKSEFFSATDLVRAGNKWRRVNNLSDFNLSQFLSLQSTKEFITSLKDKYKEEIFIKGRGRTSNTWVHPLLFIDIALAINPKLKIEVYEWLFDQLIKYRNDSGNSYKKMCGALYNKYSNKSNFHKYISELAEKIKLICHVKDWESATEQQLKKRDKIHENIYLLCDVLHSYDEAIRIALIKSID